jgi:hypothetical protein
MTTTYTQPALAIQDPASFAEMNAALEHAFAPSVVAKLLKSVKSAGLRIRDYEGVLAKGLLGDKTPSLYAKLGDSDRGQIRERYLSLVEHVAPELREKYLKIYAYY